MDGIRGGPAAAAHDPQLFEEFYRRHVDAVMSFVARRVADVHTVADLTAEVFLAALDSAHTYRPGRGDERAWLYGIARNIVSSVGGVRGSPLAFARPAPGRGCWAARTAARPTAVGRAPGSRRLPWGEALGSRRLSWGEALGSRRLSWCGPRAHAGWPAARTWSNTRSPSTSVSR
ncbi:MULTISPECIES: RNA polymerase sigma factor [Streptomyces]|uniref:RNA polymerase sigma factor n=1 Tax=Streptomyces TaxID=1883 RepID=UPI00287FE0F9|nr:sigma factor [Streptomyces sp. CGMCC 4.1456]WNF63997.1 sigma factor [Streptomyces sp. CGMCC 4.1456]